MELAAGRIREDVVEKRQVNREVNGEDEKQDWWKH
jgi:hypothetical protein